MEENIQQASDSNKELEELRAKCEEYLSGWKRAKADFINYQKDEAKRLGEFAAFANETIIKDLLIAFDTLHLALTAHPDNKEFMIVKNQLEDLLRKHGLEKISVEPGDQFDPMRHESVAVADVSPSAGSGCVAEEVEKGYTLHGKIIRPARVKVVK